MLLLYVLFILFNIFFFFFSSRRRHTRCLSDWSSDVCSSDLDLLLVITDADNVRSHIVQDSEHVEALMAQNGAVYGSKRSDKFPPLMLRYDRSPSVSIEYCSVPGNYYDQSCSWSASPLGFYEEPASADG